MQRLGRLRSRNFEFVAFVVAYRKNGTCSIDVSSAGQDVPNVAPQIADPQDVYDRIDCAIQWD